MSSKFILPFFEHDFPEALEAEIKDAGVF